MLSIGTDTITVKSSLDKLVTLDLRNVVISAMRGTNEFNFVNNNNFNQVDKSVYINYRGVSNGSISSYRFLNGSGNGTDALSPIVTGGIQTDYAELKNGNRIHRIVVGSVNVQPDGGHAMNKGSNFVKRASNGSTTSQISPVVALQFIKPMPSKNYNVFVSFSHSVNAFRKVCVADAIDENYFNICVARTDDARWESGVVEVSFMAVCYDN